MTTILKLKIIKLDETSVQSDTNTDCILIDPMVRGSIPFVDALISLDKTQLVIEIETVCQDNFKSFLQSIVNYMKSETKSNILKETLDNDFKETEIIEYLQYLGLNELFDSFYPFAKKIKIISTTIEFADMFFNFYKDSIRCHSNGSQSDYWYFFENHRWKYDYDGLEPLVETVIRHHLSLMNCELQKSFKNDSLVRGNLVGGRRPFVRNFVRGLRHRFVNCDRFSDRFDQMKYIGFNNGVYSLDELKFRDGVPEDCVSKSVGYNFSNIRSDKRNELMCLLRKIQPGEPELQELLKYTSEIFDSRRGFLFIGFSAGKDAYIKLITSTFGSDYCGEFSSDMLIDRGTIMYPQQNQKLLDFHSNKRIMVCDLMDSSCFIDCFNYDILLSNQKILVRPPYSDACTVSLMCSIIINCDSDVPPLVKGVNRNEFNSFDFTQENDDLENEIIADSKNIEHFREDFMLLLMEIYSNNHPLK